MSNVEQIALFHQQIQQDAELQQRANEAMSQGPAAVVQLAAQHGFFFTQEELEVALEAEEALKDRELSDEDLDLVAGGVERPSHKDGGGGYGRGHVNSRIRTP